MTIEQIRQGLADGKFNERLSALYGENKLAYQLKRYEDAAREFELAFNPGDDEVFVFSAPGRAEIGGNHTDHQRGRVLAAAVNADIIGIAVRSQNNISRIISEGYGEITGKGYEKGSAGSLVHGVMDYFQANGYSTGGINAYLTSEVKEGSGLSSSAAFETLIGTAINHMYNAGAVPPVQIAKAGRHAENNFFGKPSGLMDQAASAIGGLIFIDFEKDEPLIENIGFRPADHDLILCVGHTGGGHADLVEEYAAIPREMRTVANLLGHELLGQCDRDEFYKNIPEIRKKAGDRAVLRAIHFFRENNRVLAQAECLKYGFVGEFLRDVNESGYSSNALLQNIHTGSPDNQPVSIALAIAERGLRGQGACRVHGGGFAGTILAFVPWDLLDGFKSAFEALFGPGSCQLLDVRKEGACKVF